LNGSATSGRTKGTPSVVVAPTLAIRRLKPDRIVLGFNRAGG
jgi:hypothetical protein